MSKQGDSSAVVDIAKLKEAWRPYTQPVQLTTEGLDQVYTEVQPIMVLIESLKKKGSKKVKQIDGSITTSEYDIDLVMKSKMAIVRKHVSEFCREYLNALLDFDGLAIGKTEDPQEINLGTAWDEKFNKVLSFYLINSGSSFDEAGLASCMTQAEIDKHYAEQLETVVKLRKKARQRLSQVKEVEAGTCEDKNPFVPFRKIKKKVVDAKTKNKEDLEEAARKEEKKKITDRRNKKFPNLEEKAKLPKDFDGKNPTETYLKVWAGRKSKMFGYLSYPPIEAKTAHIKEEDKAYIDLQIERMFKSSETFMMKDPRFALIQQCSKMSAEDRAKQPNYRDLKVAFDREVDILSRARIDILVRRVKKAFENSFDVNKTIKGYYIFLLDYLEEKVKDFLPYTNPYMQPKPDKSIVDTVLQKIDSNAISDEEINSFSDYFTSLPVRKGVSERKQISARIMSMLSYDGPRAASLQKPDRFGNTLFSMAISTLSLEEREKLKRFNDGEEQTIKARTAGRIGDIKLQWKETLKQMKATQMHLVETPIWQYLKDPSRELLRHQLNMDGQPTGFIGRYPRDQNQQPAYYKQIFELATGLGMEQLIRQIVDEHIDYSNLSWVPFFEQLIEKESYLSDKLYQLNKRLAVRLQANMISEPLFVRIKEKVIRMLQGMSDEEFLSTAFAGQIKSLFNLSFQGYDNISKLYQRRSFSGQKPIEPVVDKKKKSPGPNLIVRMRRFIQRETPRQLLFYKVIFKDDALVQKVFDSLSFFFQDGYDEEEGFSRILGETSLFEYFEYLARIRQDKLSDAEASVYITRNLAIRTSFKASTSEKIRGRYLGLLSQKYKKYEQANLAELAISYYGNFNLVRRSLKFNPLSPKPSILLVLYFCEKIKAQVGEGQTLEFMNNLMKAFIETGSLESFKLISFDRFFDAHFLANTEEEKPYEKYDEHIKNAFAGRVTPIQSRNAINFCRQALEVLAVYYHDEQADKTLLNSMLDNLDEIIGTRSVINLILKFVASKHAKGNSRTQAYCSFLINVFVKKLVDRFPGQISDSRFTYKSPENSLLHNRFIQTAIAKGWFDSSEYEEGKRLLQPVIEYKNQQMLTQSQLLNIVLLAEHLDFSQVVFTTAYDENEKLRIFGVEESFRAPEIKAELLKLMKIPGMTRHCLKYVSWLERYEARDNAYSLGETLATLLKLNDYDFAKMAPKLWKIYTDDAHQIGLKMILLAAFMSNNIHKLNTVLGLCSKDLLAYDQYDQDVFEEIVGFHPGEDYTLGDALYSRWQGLGMLLATTVISKELKDHRVKLVEGQITIDTLPDLLRNGFACFGAYFMNVAYQVELGLAARQRGGNMQLLTNFDSNLLTMLQAYRDNFQDGASLKTFAQRIFFTNSTLTKEDRQKFREIEKEARNHRGYNGYRGGDDYYGGGGGRNHKGNSRANRNTHQEYTGLEAIDYIISQINLNTRYSLTFDKSFLKSEFETDVGDGLYFELERGDLERISQLSKEVRIAERAYKFFGIYKRVKESLMKMKNESTRMQIFALLFNNYDVVESDLKAEAEDYVELGVIDLLMAKPNIEELAQFARAIRNPARFASLIASEIQVLSQEGEKLHRRLRESDEPNFTDGEDSVHIFFENGLQGMISLGVEFVCFIRDTSVTQSLLSRLNFLTREQKELLFRMVNLRSDTDYRTYQANQDALQKVQAFVQSGASQSEGPLRDLMTLEYTTKKEPKGGKSRALNGKKALDYLDLFSIAREKESSLASNPGPISGESFLMNGWECPVNFSEALIKEIFSDQSLGMTKLAKAAAACQRAADTLSKQPAFSVDKTPVDPNKGKQEVKRPQMVTICTKAESPKNFECSEIHEFVSVWFDVVEQKSTNGRDKSSYLVKANYHVNRKNGVNYTFFDPKARHQSPFYDMISLASNLESQLSSVNEHLENDRKEGAKTFEFTGSGGTLLNLNSPIGKRAFSTNFAENLIGNKLHNERFARRRQALKVVEESIAAAVRQGTTTNNVNSEAEKLSATIGVGKLTGPAIKNASYLSAWTASINAL
jgi:hypothetical protein